MNEFHWTMNSSPELASGVRTLDAGTECLFFLLGRVFEPGVECREGTAACREAGCGKVSAIRRYLARKFGDEERMMAESGFPDGAAHAREHAAMLARLDAMAAAGACGRDGAREIHRVVASWALEHIPDHDKRFGAWTRAGGGRASVSG